MEVYIFKHFQTMGNGTENDIGRTGKYCHSGSVWNSEHISIHQENPVVLVVLKSSRQMAGIGNAKRRTEHHECAAADRENSRTDDWHSVPKYTVDQIFNT